MSGILRSSLSLCHTGVAPLEDEWYHMPTVLMVLADVVVV